MAYSKRNQELYDKAYKENRDCSTQFSYAYLANVVLSSRYSASAMHAIAAGIQAARNERRP